MNRDEVMSAPHGVSEAKATKAVADPFANQPWTIDVDVWLEPKDGKPFYLETYLPRDANDDIIFKNHRRDGFRVNFNLRDPRNTGYLFPNDLTEALYSATGTRCPTSKGQWPQFAAEGVTNGTRTLVVRNRNNARQAFGYTLRVTNGTGWQDLDPGGVNDNGQAQ
jgi:hypothetical protein